MRIAGRRVEEEVLCRELLGRDDNPSIVLVASAGAYVRFRDV
jgi:hypothetical protein